MQHCLHCTHTPARMVFRIVDSIPFCLLSYAHRCSGDFSQSKQTNYSMGLPPMSQKAIAEQLPTDLTDSERAVASQAGMYGRIWYGQGLAFDEPYQILQDTGCPHSR